MEAILGQELLKEDNEAKSLFMKDVDKKLKILDKDYDKDTEIINLKNLLDDYKKKLANIKKRNKSIIIFILSFIILILLVYIY